MGGKRVVVVGAGDTGRTALEIVRALNRDGAGLEILGFLDDDTDKRSVLGLPVLGDVGWAARHPELSYVLGVGVPETKRAIVERLGTAAVQFLSLIHPRATVLDSTQVGRGVLVNAGAVVVHDTRLGDFVTINLNATVGHDCILEDFVTVSPGANVAGRVHVGTGAVIGPNATVLQDLAVGPWATVGAGTVVIKEVPPRVVVFGNPARVVDRKVD